MSFTQRPRTLWRLVAVPAALFVLLPLTSQATAGKPTRPATIADPGLGPWQKVATKDVGVTCGLDSKLLKAAEPKFATSPVAVFRHGRLCWSFGGTATTNQFGAFSVTKTFTSVVFGIIAARTSLRDTDVVTKWLKPNELGDINPQATVGHILSMAATSPDLSRNRKLPFNYDSLGAFQIQSLILILDRAVQRSPNAFPGLSSAGEVATRELIQPLGMRATEWNGGTVATSLLTSVEDLGRLGQLLLRHGRWAGRQILDEDYVYRMSHPAFEDANPGYGYLTWLNTAGTADQSGGNGSDLDCSPFATWRKFPHAPAFDNPDDAGGTPFPDGADVGVYYAVGVGGALFWVHPALDLVIAINSDPAEQPGRPWAYLRSALIAKDPVYKGNVDRFCEAYRRGRHTPDLVDAWKPSSGFGSIADHVSAPLTVQLTPPRSGPRGLAVHRNSLGISLPDGSADMDRAKGGYSPLFVASTGAPVIPGSSFESQGFAYTLPEAVGGFDNVLTYGQTVFPEKAVPGATRLGLLGGGYGGGATGTLSVNYEDGSSKTFFRMPDWQYEPGQLIAPLGSMRTLPPDTALALNGRNKPATDSTYMWSVTVPLDPHRRLVSVTLPRYVHVHVFDMQIR